MCAVYTALEETSLDLVAGSLSAGSHSPDYTLPITLRVHSRSTLSNYTLPYTPRLHPPRQHSG